MKKLGFELIEDSPERKTFSTTCGCMGPDHTCGIELEYDKEEKELTMGWHTKVLHHFFGSGFERIINKLKMCFRILINKEIEYETAFKFRGRNHIDNFTDMIYILGNNVKKESNELDECKKKLKRR